jgi:hypothetical protein
LFTVSTQKVPFPFRNVVAFFSFDLRHHANLGDVFLQFGFRLLNIDIEKLADVAELPTDELANAPDLGGN